jgi:hypothetical protein
MIASDLLQIDSTALIPDEPSSASMIVNLATDQDIRARVHELLMLAERPAPQGERRRDRRYPYPYLVRMTPVGGDGRSPSGQTIIVVGRTLSEGGFGFYHSQPLAERRMIASFHAGDDRWLGFLMDLRWCRFIGEGWYESGGRFLMPVPGLPAAETGAGI